MYAYCYHYGVFQLPRLALVVKNMPASVGDARDNGLIPEFGRSP